MGWEKGTIQQTLARPASRKEASNPHASAGGGAGLGADMKPPALGSNDEISQLGQKERTLRTANYVARAHRSLMLTLPTLT
ncbi:hypothetical protein O1611_g9971 [Lasiodiplodia mahajangana]|uniref:Uncharacterized protein n=1 Tax=Lasiodiplodia mahajangana TaxID=1108764 RepID=A0ACC2J3A6_9PEZI|nr:hypothetical protein O1611_g9971 [Lasiodiplodia mahajangana]